MSTATETAAILDRWTRATYSLFGRSYETDVRPGLVYCRDGLVRLPNERVWMRLDSDDALAAWGGKYGVSVAGGRYSGGHTLAAAKSDRARAERVTGCQATIYPE